MRRATKFKQTEIGIIPEDWKVDELQELSERICVGYVGSCQSDYCEDRKGIPMIRTTNLSPHGLIMEDLKYVTPEFHQQNKKSQLKKGDVLIARHGEKGVACVYNVDKEANCLNIVIIRPKPEPLLSFFILYGLKSPYVMNQIRANQVGTVQGVLNTKVIAKLLFPIPATEERVAIAKFLRSLDSKIELNQQMNEILEEIGKAVFKHWLIDFEFPNDEGKPYKSSGGEMVYREELGKEIPKGWKVEPFSKVIAVNPRRELPKGKPARKVSMADLNPWQSWIDTWSITEYKSGPKFTNGDTLFARITPSLEHGKTAFVSILDENEVAFGSTEFIVFGKKALRSAYYIFHLSRSDDIRNIAISAMTGTSGRQRVPDELFDNLPVILPPVTVLDEFERICSSWFDMISKNAKENKILLQIRDSLLPELMSGRIRIPL